jgi:hypothetical protein
MNYASLPAAGTSEPCQEYQLSNLCGEIVQLLGDSSLCSYHCARVHQAASVGVVCSMDVAGVCMCSAQSLQNLLQCLLLQCLWNGAAALDVIDGWLCCC